MSNFQNTVLQWFELNKRDLPWRKTSDPYKIWLSEVILQQTRVEQGTEYFLRFDARFPSVFDFAAATEQEILLLWQGLGYYSRARNMHHTAKVVVADFEGQFPASHDALLKLKGIGPYAAAAIASIAFNLEHAVVDGNVYRVLARFFGIATPIDSTAGKKAFFKLANDLIKNHNPGTYNQAVMEFGALQCKPARPDCGACVLKNRCKAFNDNRVAELPVKSKKVKVKHRTFHYYVPIHHKTTLLAKRGKGDIWQGLWEFPLVERGLNDIDCQSPILEGAEWIDSGFFKMHKITHQTIEVRFFILQKAHTLPSWENTIVVALSDLSTYPFPVVIDTFIKQVLLRTTSLRLE